MMMINMKMMISDINATNILQLHVVCIRLLNKLDCIILHDETLVTTLSFVCTLCIIGYKNINDDDDDNDDDDEDNDNDDDDDDDI